MSSEQKAIPARRDTARPRSSSSGYPLSRLKDFFSAHSAPVYRRPTDVIFLVLGVLVVLLAALAFVTTRGYLRIGDVLLSVARLVPSAVTELARNLLEVGSFGAVLVAVLLAALTRRWLLVRNLVIAGILTWVLTGVIEWGIGLTGVSALHAGIPSSDVAMIAALAMVTDAFLTRKWIPLNWALLLVIALLEFLLASFSTLQILGGLGLGLLLGALTNVLLGVPQADIALQAIREAFDAYHLEIKSIRPIATDARGSVPYFVSTPEGEYFVKLVGAQQRNADFLFKLYRTALLKDPASTAPFLTATQQIEHEAYLTLVGQKQGVRTPDIEFTARVVEDYALLAQKRIEGRQLLDLEDKYLIDSLLTDIWRQVALLHAARIYHGDLRLTNILVDRKNQPWIIDFGFSAAGAEDQVLAHDTAQLLASMSYVVGAERAVVTGRNALGPEALKQALPNLNPLVLSSATRAELSEDPELLDEIKEEIEQECGVPPKEEQESPFRVRRRDLFWVIGLGIGVYVFLPQLGQLSKILEAWRAANMMWVAVGVLGSALTYAIAPFPTQGALDRTLSYARFLAAQFAATFASRLGPQGLGGVYIIERFLEKSGVPRRRALTAVTVSTAVGPFIHTILMVIALALVGIHGVSLFKGIQPWQIGIGGAVLAVILFFLWRSDRLGKAVESVKASMRDLAAVFKSPLRGLELLGGSLGVTLTYIATLYFCMHAVGANATVLSVAAVYLAGSVIGSASPTPGGLGVLEGAFIAAFTAFGVSTSQAVAGVLLYRLLTFWLPILPGLVAFRYLQSENCI